jgi:hypothetical protein
LLNFTCWQEIRPLLLLAPPLNEFQKVQHLAEQRLRLVLDFLKQDFLYAHSCTISSFYTAGNTWESVWWNAPEFGFYQRLGFQELLRVGEGKDDCIYMAKTLRA